MSRELMEAAEALASNVAGMSELLLAEYDKFCETVRTNGLQRLHNKNWRTTFEIPGSQPCLEWRPEEGVYDIIFVDGDDTYWMPKAWLEDPEAWLQGALAAHGQAVADQFVNAAQKRAERKAELRRRLEKLEAEE